MFQCFKCGNICLTSSIFGAQPVCDGCREPFEFFWSGVLDLLTDLGQIHAQAIKVCECGWTLQEFAKGSRLGCQKCYQTFCEELSPILQRFHGATQHTGKVPSESKPDR